MEYKKIPESEVLSDVLSELKRFDKKLKELISDLKTNKNEKFQYSRYRASVKRAAIDLKNELSKITTSSGVYGEYYYKKK